MSTCEEELSLTVQYFTYIISDPIFLSGSIIYFLLCLLRLQKLAFLTQNIILGMWDIIYNIFSSAVYFPDERSKEWNCDEAGVIMSYYIVSFIADPIAFVYWSFKIGRAHV